MGHVRRPVVAGAFYPRSKDVLERELEDMIQPLEPRKKVTGLISPHAGYVYSGACAGKGFGRIKVPGTVVILGVNHQGFGHPYAVDGHDSWETPLGEVIVDQELKNRLVEGSDVFAIDGSAGSREHSLEVQVPFIQYMNSGARILPITISSWELEPLLTGGRELGRLLKDNDDVLMVASSDMSHYISAESAKVQDDKAIARILALDPSGLFDVVRSENISMCGVAPAAMMLAAALELGAKTAEVIDYTNSGAASGDYNQVVAYLCAAVY